MPIYSDIDECALEADNCDINSECSNTIGSYDCTCNMGYTGSGIMSDCSKYYAVVQRNFVSAFVSLQHNYFSK